MRKCRPLSVRAMPWGERMNRLTPSRPSSSWMALVTADWEILRWMAAWEICPTSAVATK
ncbi:hypothetical protein D3C73_1643860 [compost metagenome]